MQGTVITSLFFRIAAAAAAVLFLAGNQVSGQSGRIAYEDWIVVADLDACTLSVDHARLGCLLTNVQLNIPNGQELVAAKGWTVTNARQGLLQIKTAQPQSTWLFEPGPLALKISCTAADAALAAQVPVGGQRTVARLLDREGFSVEWTGTDEVANGYHGTMTRNPSFLPRQNPECMYFGLGKVSGGVFRSLFDRATDTAVEFPDQTRLANSNRQADCLELTLPFSGSVQIRVLPDYYTKTLGLPLYVPFDDRSFPKPPMVWCSWTSYYGDVTEQEVVRNADWLAEHLKPYGFQYVQLDDGYDSGQKAGHYWIEHWDARKFPHGPKWLADYIKSKGLHPGLWLVPNAYAGAVEAHPEWYLRDKQGKIVLDYGTPALDSTNPEVLDFLKRLFTALGDWGFEYYKFDGEHALPKYIPAVDRQKVYAKDLDPLAAYRNRLEVIRKVIGPSTFVEGCPAGTPLNGIGFFNSYFNGQDVYNNWNGMYALFSSINANAFLNRRVVYVMPGEGMELGEPMSVEEARRKRTAAVVETARSREEPLTGIGLTLPEARTLVSLVALSGVVYPLAGVMPETPAERLALMQRTLPTMPIAPLDLFSRGTDSRWDTFKHVRADDYVHHYPEILDLKVNAKSGVYDVVALPNWRSAAVARSISFSDKLGLSADRDYIAFDFWNQKLLGVFQNRMSLDVGGHDTRVVLVHPVLDRPQLIGLSRHITGACSIQAVTWDSSQKVLKGVSDTVEGQEYTLFLYVPDKMRAVKAQVGTKSKSEIPVQLERSGALLSVTFPGSADPASWQVEFAPQ
jgi:hypothetical protein